MKTKLERALFTNRFENIKKDIDRIYFGNEFCENLIPTISTLKKIYLSAKVQNKKFTFVTPFVTEYGLKRLSEIFLWLKKRETECEIVVNDWGVLEYLHRELKGYFELSLGRLLVRQQRDPAMQKVLEKQLPFAIKGKDGKI